VCLTNWAPQTNGGLIFIFERMFFAFSSASSMPLASPSALSVPAATAPVLRLPLCYKSQQLRRSPFKKQPTDSIDRNRYGLILLDFFVQLGSFIIVPVAQIIRFLYSTLFITVSSAGLVGGGSIPKPGEVSLAHRGVLFLDEFPEFTRSVLEVLRQPLEDRRVTIGRARAVYTFPSDFLLAAAMNPCPCGYHGAEIEAHSCRCSPLQILKYRSRLSGPLLDRIDVHVEVPRLSYANLKEQGQSLSSSEMLHRVMSAGERQLIRYRGLEIHSNKELGGKLLHQIGKLTKEGEAILSSSFERLGLSARAYDRILRLARTIADLEDSETIEPEHVAEAIQYRNLDKKSV
jgi:hypothetical protein